MAEVKCTFCDWEGYMDELGVDEYPLSKYSTCPECGSSSEHDYLKIKLK